MARQLRLEYAGALYHVTARGNARQAIYLDDTDRQQFLTLLGREVEQQQWCCYAYCLMANHYHLLLETPEPNLSRGMRRLNGVYTQGFNRRHGRVGHVLQGRFTSLLVEKEAYLLELCRYVVLNPVRARMVRTVQAWAWSSYRATVGREVPPRWLDVSDDKKGTDLFFDVFVLSSLVCHAPRVLSYRIFRITSCSAATIARSSLRVRKTTTIISRICGSGKRRWVVGSMRTA